MNQFHAYVLVEALSSIAIILSFALNTVQSTVPHMLTIYDRHACATPAHGNVHALASQDHFKITDASRAFTLDSISSRSTACVIVMCHSFVFSAAVANLFVAPTIISSVSSVAFINAQAAVTFAVSVTSANASIPSSFVSSASKNEAVVAFNTDRFA